MIRVTPMADPKILKRGRKTMSRRHLSQMHTANYYAFYMGKSGFKNFEPIEGGRPHRPLESTTA